MAIISFVKRHTVVSVILLCFVCGGGYYFYSKGATTTVTPSFYVVDTVAKGTVSSGIQTTGKIVAEQKLDLDVYKQLSRINTVNTANGGHVEKGSVLVSFDKSDVLVDTQSSRVALSAAELALETERANAKDPSTKARTLQNQILEYKKSIANATQDIKDAYLDFLNKNIEATPASDQVSRLATRSVPKLSGRYIGTASGSYTIEVYNSGAASRFSYRISGLENAVGSVVLDKALDLGRQGLKITFADDIRDGDMWVIEVPNVTTTSYAETKRAYEQTVSDLKVAQSGYSTNLKNAEQDLEDLLATDSSAYRDLNVEKATLSVNSEKEKLSRNYDVLRERDIVAPFPGTIQDMANVVVGATPTGGTSDTINLGTLISDTFLATFTLSATDVAKVTVGQNVKVTVTSFAEQPILEGTISEISSLPSADGVAQYTVKAKLDYDRTKASVILREGVLADIEVVQEEKSDALRIPVSALTYESGKPSVRVVDSLTEAQKEEINSLGIVRVANGTTLPSYLVPVELGIQGKYFVEIVSGVNEGAYILTTETTGATGTSVVEQRGPRAGGTGAGSGGTTNQPRTTGNTSANSTSR